jgi:hypothetical protein
MRGPGHLFGALNRIQFVPLPHWRRASVADQEYVQQEMAAFYTSRLFAWPGPVLSPASSSLSGAWRTPMEWMKLAAQAGLGVPVCHNGQVLASVRLVGRLSWPCTRRDR